jgi:hyperosmotically inducible periplasmic protein
MYAKRSKMRPLLITLILFSAPGLFFTETSSGYESSSSNPASSASAVPPDNSGKNVRDRGRNAITPFDQSTNRSDVETTRKIRRALTKDKSLSTTARNIKVVTMDGTVILRGPVKSEHEKVAIANKAQQIAGAGHVNDQLEIARH